MLRLPLFESGPFCWRKFTAARTFQGGQRQLFCVFSLVKMRKPVVTMSVLILCCMLPRKHEHVLPIALILISGSASCLRGMLQVQRSEKGLGHLQRVFALGFSLRMLGNVWQTSTSIFREKLFPNFFGFLD